MRSSQHILLVLVQLFFITFSTSCTLIVIANSQSTSRAPPRKNNLPENMQQSNSSNKTTIRSSLSNESTATTNRVAVYENSKQLCWGCIGEALQFLFAHNMARASKGELPLVWDFQLERYAKWWADERKSDCRPEHSFQEGGFKLGENIYWGSGSTWTPSDAVRAWVDEQRYYHCSTNNCDAGEVCGHYTQVVWRNTRRIGCARVVCNDGDVFMTCNYDPVGNYIGQRTY